MEVKVTLAFFDSTSPFFVSILKGISTGNIYNMFINTDGTCAFFLLILLFFKLCFMSSPQACYSSIFGPCIMDVVWVRVEFGSRAWEHCTVINEEGESQRVWVRSWTKPWQLSIEEKQGMILPCRQWQTEARLQWWPPSGTESRGAWFWCDKAKIYRKDRLKKVRSIGWCYHLNKHLCTRRSCHLHPGPLCIHCCWWKQV